MQPILRHLGLPAEVPEPRPARAPPGKLPRSRANRRGPRRSGRHTLQATALLHEASSGAPRNKKPA
jgi:hypothetical protein